MMSMSSLLKMLSMMLFILSLMTYFMCPAEGEMILSNISDLVSGTFFNQTSALLNNTDLNNTDLGNILMDTTQTMDTQIPASETTDTASPDMFYGVSKAPPGTFMMMVQKWYLRMLSSATTPSTWTTPMTSSASTATNAANTIGMSTMLSGFMFMSWMVGMFITTWK